MTLIQMVNVDTRSFVATILDKLTQMPRLMVKAKSDISAFNATIDGLIDALNTRETAIPDIVPQLFAAYKSVDDEDFVRYITSHEQAGQLP
jgi:hypothetical protein